VRGILAAVVVSVALAAAAQAASGLVTHAVAGTPLRIGLPADWRPIDHATALALIKRSARLNSQVAGIVSALAQNGSLIRLVAIDPHPRGGFTTNANVVVEPAPAASVAAATALGLPALRQVLRPIELKQRTTRVAGRPAISVSFEARFNEPNGTRLIAERQVYLVSAGKLYVLTLTTLSSQRAFYGATFARIVGSLALPQ
jgi:hypothetical protein